MSTPVIDTLVMYAYMEYLVHRFLSTNLESTGINVNLLLGQNIED